MCERPEWGRSKVFNGEEGSYLSVPCSEGFEKALGFSFETTQVVWHPTSEEWWIADAVMDEVADMCELFFKTRPE